jgi:flagellar hook-associated protein 1 FlgK
VTSEVGLGKLGGLLSSASEIRSGPLQRLDALTASLVAEVNGLHRSGFGLDGLSGRDFFNSDLTVAIQDPMMIGAAAQATEPGDNTIALQMAELSGEVIGALGSAFSEYYGGIVAAVGTLARGASDMHTFDENLLVELQNRRDSVSGVSLDEEAMNLVRFQRSFEAGARMMQVTDELLETIINL